MPLSGDEAADGPAGLRLGSTGDTTGGAATVCVPSWAGESDGSTGGPLSDGDGSPGPGELGCSEGPGPGSGDLPGLGLPVPEDGFGSGDVPGSSPGLALALLSGPVDGAAPGSLDASPVPEAPGSAVTPAEEDGPAAGSAGSGDVSTFAGGLVAALALDGQPGRARVSGEQRRHDDHGVDRTDHPDDRAEAAVPAAS